ncbi:MAG: site-specific DNA-methyltransferase [Spirochaetes bacterium]|nr:site-specific DNA-methyltransferase [Spirochaetota bacterium]
MRNELDILLDKVHDPILRADIQSQVERLRAKRTFGLVFESHLPERVRLPEHPIHVGVKVALRDEPNSATFEVLAVHRKTVTLRKVRNPDGSSVATGRPGDPTNETTPLDSLVVIADFGEPIFPGLRSIDSVRRGGEKAAHVIIKGENHHVLQALQFTHAGKIDCIYIDPPYNTGARDWKYDNNYVDDTDAYRHSKWLAFMERRLRLARQLLNPRRSMLIVAIDEKEVHRLGLLLRQNFGGCKVQMVSTLINPAGSARKGEFGRTDEYLFFVYIGDAGPQPLELDRDWFGKTSSKRKDKLRWQELSRRGDNGRRSARPNLFYPIFVAKDGSKIRSIGEAISLRRDRRTVVAPKGTITIWPIRADGTDGTWGRNPASLRESLAKGYVRLGGFTKTGQGIAVYHMARGEQVKVETGVFEIVGRRPDGSIVVDDSDYKTAAVPGTQWNIPSHDASTYGSALLRRLLPDRRFPFPKSLYAVEDALRFFVKDKPDAVVLDFFGGSGTTAHAVARLNRQDAGTRQAIVVTNNEVSMEEAQALRSKGTRPGDREWEALGIFEHIAQPRITAAITGSTSLGTPIHGDYTFTDAFPMAEGFDENVEFFELTYLDAEAVELDKAFRGIAPLLWLRAGGRGPIIDESLDSAGRRKPYAWTNNYGVLYNPDRWRSFVEKLPKTATAAFIVTDSQTTFTGVASELPGSLDVVRLYENYLTTFAINQGRI